MPICVPMTAPAIAATAKYGSSGGSARSAKTFPARAAAELSRLKGAVTPAAERAFAYPSASKNGERKMPPPTPVKPESKPLAGRRPGRA